VNIRRGAVFIAVLLKLLVSGYWMLATSGFESWSIIVNLVKISVLVEFVF
jgi:hypothetical protein